MADVFDWSAERARRGLPPVLALPARCAPEPPRHSVDGDEAFSCGECGAVYYGFVLRGDVLGLLCSGCGTLREIRQLLTEAGL